MLEGHILWEWDGGGAFDQSSDCGLDSRNKLVQNTIEEPVQKTDGFQKNQTNWSGLIGLLKNNWFKFKILNFFFKLES
jgi:hypothetical protein